MRKLILASLLFTACAGREDQLPDTTAAVDTPAVSVAESLYVGTWNGRSYRTDTDSGTPWTMRIATGPADSLTGTLRFAAGTEDIPVRVTEATESALKSAFGPYRSPTAANAEVTTETEAKVEGDSLVGTFIATPTAGGDPFRGRFVARRAQ